MSPSVEIAVRVGGSAVVFAIMALWEWFAPRRHLTAGRRPRWPGNLGILAVDIIAVRLLVPTAAFGVALVAAAHGWGLFKLLALPAWAALPLGAIALDLVIYGQHVVFHHVPALWRLHRMHHADLDIDVTTGVRFHPLEILLSLAIKMAAVAALGALGDRRGLPAVLAACDDVPAVRRRAVLALAPFEGAAVDAALERARTDRDWQVRQAAEDLLGDDAPSGEADD